MKHIYVIEEKDGKIRYTEVDEVERFRPAITVDFPDDFTEKQIETEVFWAADSIYREMKRHYLIQDILNECETLGKDISPDDAEYAADRFERIEDCTLPYWANVDNAIEETGL